jgi:amino acid transporter
MQPAETTGQASADQVLAQFGYRQELRRELKRFASFAVGFSFISITTGIFTTYGSVLGWGGPLGIWTWPIVIVGQLFVSLVFAALASRIPLAGYSYQWASRLANPKVGWLVGWLSFIFLVADVVAVDYAVAQTVLPSVLNYPSTIFSSWMGTAIVIVLQALLIIFSTHWSTRVNNVAVGTEVVGIVGLTLLLLIVGGVRGGLHAGHLFSMGSIPAKGYFSLGTLNSASPFVLSFLLGAFTIVGFEAAANLAEETETPHVTVPRAMWLSVVLSGVVGMACLIALNLASGNLVALQASSTPVADIITGTLNSVVGKLFLVFVTFSIFACGLVIFITATRLAWAMSRDERFPGYQLFRQVHPVTDTPVAATIMLAVLMEAVLAAFGTQSTAETTILANLFSVATLLPCLIYLATVILYVYARRTLPAAQGFRLGSFEWPIVVLSLVWLLFELSIFRDRSFAAPWLYTAVMFGIGLIYFAWLLIRRPRTLQTIGEAGTAPGAGVISGGARGQP